VGKGGEESRRQDSSAAGAPQGPSSRWSAKIEDGKANDKSQKGGQKTLLVGNVGWQCEQVIFKKKENLACG